MVDEGKERLNSSREKNKGMHRRKKAEVKLSSCGTPAGTSDALDVQNKWEENTHTRQKQKQKKCST